ncbi:kinase-like domain-containing protein, partial [Neocallimastix sp. 'constans']
LTFLKGKLDEISSPLAFCHCDLLYGNLIYHKDENGNDDVTFIDYEYGSINPRGFDIGNHFNEFAGKEDVTEKEIEDIYREVNKFALLSHFYWGVWSILQAKYSQIDFDYSSYAVLKLDEYFKNKEKFLAL